MQFRCAGSVEYVEWAESVLSGADRIANQKLAKAWQHEGDSAQMEFCIFDNPEELEDSLRHKHDKGNNVRLLSSYSRSWKTESAAKPHDLPAALQDFHEPYHVHGEAKYWSRSWNHVPGRNDYTWFVAGPPGSFIAEDPLCEVGCPYAVRGFDYDFIGILWLNDLQWRGDKWIVNPDAVEESGVMGLTRKARRETRIGSEGPATVELLERIKQAYRILLTRALKGVYLWIPDDETREYIGQSLVFRANP